MFKKSLIIGLTFLLISCGVTESKPTGKVTGDTFSNGEFSISVPRDWEVVTDFTDELDKETIVGIRNNVKSNPFVANINVTYKTVDAPVDITALSDSLAKQNSSLLTNFKTRDRIPFDLNVGGTPHASYIHSFEGSFAPELDPVRILQTFGYKDNHLYTITGIYALNDEQFAKEKVEAVVKSFQIE